MCKYDTCKKCGAEAVHLAKSGLILLFGDSDDQEGNASEYEGEEAGADGEVSVGAHVCFSCGEIEDVFIDYPREKVICIDTLDDSDKSRVLQDLHNRPANDSVFGRIEELLDDVSDWRTLTELAGED